MKGLSSTFLVTCILTLFSLPSSLSAQSARSALDIYSEGNVWHMIYVRTEQGHRERYLDSLRQVWTRQVELAEEMGFVVDHHVLTKWPNDKDDWDVLIIEIFPNMAAYDTFWENWSKVDEQIINDPDREREQGSSLNAERELLGVQIAREVIFKPVR